MDKCQFCNNDLKIIKNYYSIFECNCQQLTYFIKNELNEVVTWKLRVFVKNYLFLIEVDFSNTSLLKLTSITENIHDFKLILKIDQFTEMPNSIEELNIVVDNLYKLNLYK